MGLTATHWNSDEKDALGQARSYADLFSIAKGVIERMRQPVVQVCGPISTGGVDSMVENIKRLGSIIDELEQKGIEIFNQVPFQLRMQEIREAKGERGYDYTLLNEFYLPLFESNLIRELYFLPDWRSSVGSQWEHEQAERLGMKITYL